jgi:hypothetical protein
VVIDDYTSEQNRIVHFVVNKAMLHRIEETLDDSETAVFTLAPAEKPRFPLDILSLPGEKFLLQLSWGPDIIETGVPTTFVMNIQDPATGDLLRGSSFDLVLIQVAMRFTALTCHLSLAPILMSTLSQRQERSRWLQTTSIVKVKVRR